MNSFEEIDREQAAYVKAANEALAGMRDKGGRWWEYAVSHQTFELVVGEPLGKDNLVLSLAACDYIAGPVIWPEQRLEVIWRCDRARARDVWEFTLQDESVGFKAVGGVFAWKRDYDLLKEGNLHVKLFYGGARKG